MKQVDFYIVANRARDGQYKFASRLVNKLRRLEKRTLVITPSADECQRLSKILWSFRDTSFVAHECLVGEYKSSQLQRDISAGLQFCLLSDALSVNSGVLETNFDVLINLHNEVPLYNHHFDRIAEIVDADESAKQAARARFKTYQSEGFKINTHTVSL